MKKHLSTILLLGVMAVGLTLLLYPSVSDYWNSFHQSRAIASYSESVAMMTQADYDRMANSDFILDDMMDIAAAK